MKTRRVKDAAAKKARMSNKVFLTISVPLIALVTAIVVVANVAAAPAERAVPPERALEAPRVEPVDTGLSPAVPDVIRLQESPPRPAAGGEGERR